MPVAARLLPSTRGSGGFTVPARTPPLDNAWTRQGRVLAPSVAWESTSIQEPDVTRADGIFKMWAKGGWATTGLGYYTSANGTTWSRNAGNPVLGSAPEVSQPMIFWDGTQYRCYYNSGGDSDPNTPRYATSTDGTTWTIQGSGSFITNPGAITQWGNRHVWKEGASWYMLQEARVTTWRTYRMTSTDGATWTLGAEQTSLRPTVGWNYGGPTMLEVPKIGGRYHVWYHAGSGSTSDLYHSASDTASNDWDTPNLVLTHSGTGDEVDQVADPSIVILGNTAYLFYAGVDNTAETGVILLATGAAT